LVFIRRWQELEDRARERYGTLNQMSSELRRLREQRDILDALVDALSYFKTRRVRYQTNLSTA
jgi:hypothetical protein